MWSSVTLDLIIHINACIVYIKQAKARDTSETMQRKNYREAEAAEVAGLSQRIYESTTKEEQNLDVKREKCDLTNKIRWIDWKSKELTIKLESAAHQLAVNGRIASPPELG